MWAASTTPHDRACGEEVDRVALHEKSKDSLGLCVGRVHPAHCQKIGILGIALLVMGFTCDFCKERRDVLDLMVNHALEHRSVPPNVIGVR